MNRMMGILAIILFANSAAAEVVYCRFERGRKVSTAAWDNSRNVLVTTFGIVNQSKQVRTYNNVTVRSELPPYNAKGISVVVFGDVPALHLRLTNRASLVSDRETIYPFEAYWGEIPGRIKLNGFESFLSPRGAKFGSRGVCWTKRNPPHPRSRNNGGDRGSKVAVGKKSSHDCKDNKGKGKGKGGERSGGNSRSGGKNR